MDIKGIKGKVKDLDWKKLLLRKIAHGIQEFLGFNQALQELPGAGTEGILIERRVENIWINR